jgi:transposase
MRLLGFRPHFKVPCWQIWFLCGWRDTAILELPDIRITKCTKDCLYRTSDDLMALHKDIETALRQRELDLFSPSRSVILYDITNSLFEGFCASNSKAKHGNNKQHRNDCRQIAVGIAFDAYGFPLAHETFEALPGRSEEQRVEVKKSPIPRTPRATWSCAAAPSAASRGRP